MTIREWLATQGRTRFIIGDNPPPDVVAQIDALVTRHRVTLGLPVAGFVPTGRDANAALEWQEQR